MSQTTQADETAPSTPVSREMQQSIRRWAMQADPDAPQRCVTISLLDTIEIERAECEKLRSKVAEAAAVLPLLVKITAREQRYACADRYWKKGRAVSDLEVIAMRNLPAPDFETVLAASQKWMNTSNEVSHD